MENSGGSKNENEVKQIQPINIEKGRYISSNEEIKSDRSFIATLLFCLLLGPFGVHRFYVGKVGTGILMLLTAGLLVFGC